MDWRKACRTLYLPIFYNRTMKKEQIENYVSSYNTFDVEGMIRDLSPEIVFENISNGELTHQTKGIEAFREQATAAKAYFSSRRQIIRSWKFDEEVVTIDIEYEATLAQDFPNGLKAGDQLKLKGQSVFTFVDGSIVKIQDRS